MPLEYKYDFANCKILQRHFSFACQRRNFLAFFQVKCYNNAIVKNCLFFKKQITEYTDNFMRNEGRIYGKREYGNKSCIVE